MKQLFTISILVVVLYVLYSTPYTLYPTASAQSPNIWAGTGNCNDAQGGCSLCDAMVVVKNIIDFLFKIAIPIGVGMMMYGAIRLIVSAGSPDAVAAGKKVMLNAAIGIAIALAAWAIINTALNLLAGEANILPWNEITCKS